MSARPRAYAPGAYRLVEQQAEPAPPGGTSQVAAADLEAGYQHFVTTPSPSRWASASMRRTPAIRAPRRPTPSNPPLGTAPVFSGERPLPAHLARSRALWRADVRRRHRDRRGQIIVYVNLDEVIRIIREGDDPRPK